MQQSTLTPRSQLLTYLKDHRIWQADAILWQWLVAHPMRNSDPIAIINQLKTWLDAFRPLPADVVAELRERYLVRFTYHSNALEGNTLTQSETELVLTTGITIGGKTLREHLEVIGHQDAIAYIETLAQQTTPISDWELRQIHRLILLKISPEEAGTYRTLDVQAAGTGYVYPPHYLLNDLVADFIQWLNSEAQSLHPVLYAAEAHARFVLIHPFRDGNGRTGRLLMNLLLLRAGYPIVIITNENRQRYIENLVLGQQSQNWQPFYELVTAATETSLIEVLGVLTTATSGKDRGAQFYEDILDFLTHKTSPSN